MIDPPKIKSRYAAVLNALDEMQQSPYYAVRREVLAQAERAIVELEKDNSEAQEVYRILLRQAEKGNTGPVDVLNTIIKQRDEANKRMSDYRARLAQKLQLDHMARQTYSKTDIIIALDQTDCEGITP